jgi:cyclopropane fatty-acyl-phospholipid synthase-like methyltransferase
MKNTLIYYIIIIISCLIVLNCFKQKKMYLNIFIIFICYIIIFFVLEAFDILSPYLIWDQTERTKECYEWFEHYFKKNYDKDKTVDYSESLFLGKYDTPVIIATKQKYDYIYNQLNLSSGKTLLDCGCGIGTWMSYCKERGVDVIGLTLSEEQAKVIRKKGLTVYVADYRILNKEFINKFDAVSLLGSTEHICSQNQYYNSRKKTYDTYYSLFNIVNQYVKPNGNILLTVLVDNNKMFTFNDYTQGYILERHYGGFYSTPNVICKAITDNKLNINFVEDHTIDYHWVSVVEPNHFGHWYIDWSEDTFSKIMYIIRGILMDPFLIHHWLYYFRDSWMWHIGGYQKTPLTPEQVKKAPANLKYISIHKN